MKDSKPKPFRPHHAAGNTGVVRHTVLAVLVCVAAACVGQVISIAQKLYVPVKVSSVSAQTSASGSVVSIAADAALSKAQTWQDEEGFHVVLPNTIAAESLKPTRGVKVRRIGSSLEILALTKPGTRVSLSSAQNQLNLIFDGKLQTRTAEDRAQSNSSTEAADDAANLRALSESATRYSSAPGDLSKSQEPAAQGAQTQGDSSSVMTVQDLSNSGSIQTPQQSGDPSVATIEIQTEDESVLASIFSGTSVLIVSAFGLVGLLVSRKIRSKRAVSVVAEESQELESAASPNRTDDANSNAGSTSLVRSGEPSPDNRLARKSNGRMQVAGPASMYGAYRIDQEVGKLILGQPHRIDVVSARGVDDRRAVETSLIKGVNSPEFDESAQRRAREALEEYGFVARQCAALLLAPDAFERTSAARTLGEIKSGVALPFLLESLYDTEPIVRNQAVLSIGELKMPSAIGALLDIARTHPDVPSSLLSRTLSACSVEGLDFFDVVLPDSQLGPGDVGSIIQEITHLEPSAPFESLPEDSDDEQLALALTSIESDDVDERSTALKVLVQFRVQSAVDAIARVAREDAQSTLRSHAISSLGSINHESVFATVVMGMADESREVRAAAARAVNRLSFDRADAYARLIETSDEDTLRSVAKACIQAGIISQNLDRLSNADHRQAYETFSLIALLTKAGMNEPVLEAISNHPRTDVRLKTIHLLALTGHPDMFSQFRELAVKDGVGEVVKTALLEAMYKLDQNRLKDDEIIDDMPVAADATLENDASSPLTLEVEPEFDWEVATAFEAIQRADELEL